MRKTSEYIVLLSQRLDTSVSSDRIFLLSQILPAHVSSEYVVSLSQRWATRVSFDHHWVTRCLILMLFPVTINSKITLLTTNKSQNTICWLCWNFQNISVLLLIIACIIKLQIKFENNRLIKPCSTIHRKNLFVKYLVGLLKSGLYKKLKTCE